MKNRPNTALKTTLKTALIFALWIAVFEGVSFASAMMTNDNIASWYATLAAPPLVPPNWVFPVVWSVLYAMIACAGCLLWRRGEKQLLGLFGVYMLFNWSWSFIYFGQHLIGTALVTLIVMDVLLVTLILKGWGRVRVASLLLLPLLGWSGFATYLNAGYWWLN